MRITLFAAAAVLLPGSVAASAATPAHVVPKLPRIVSISVEPAALTLTGARDVRGILVTGRTAAGYGYDLSPIAHIVPASPVVRVTPDGEVAPLKAGRTTLLVTAGGHTASVPVVVRGVGQPPISFVREVMPVLSRVGCTAGTCHGAARGKNGFKLSLRGYDPDFDHHALVDEMQGRRVNRADPAQSLILLKPSETVPHKGGLVLPVGSPYYNLIKRWISEGASTDYGTVKRANRLEVLPAVPNLTLPGMAQRTLVIAHYPDGSTRDVTHEAVFTSSVPDVAVCDAGGAVSAVRRGEAALLVRYEGNYASTRLTVLGDRTGYRWAAAPEYGYIDRLVDAKLRKIEALASPVCNDATFLRRVSLDLTGLPPSPEAARAFLADRTPQRVKRARLVDALIGSPAFVQHWTNKWSDLLSVNSKYLGDTGVRKFRDWIQQTVATNMPYDRFVHTLLTASGDVYSDPPAAYMLVDRDPNTATENVTQLFLGVRFSCNKCHDHPFERWTQTQYYQFGAFFARVGYKPGRDNGDTVVYDSGKGEVMHPKTALAVAPEVPVGTLVRTADMHDRRDELAGWLVSPKNPYFSRAMVNRLWSYFLGKGIIDPVDDIRAGNPPSNPELLEALNTDFVQSGFDLRHMMRTIIMSRAYQSSIDTNRWNADDTLNFSHALPRRLDAEELLDAIRAATGTQSSFDGLPPGAAADMLPDANVQVNGDDLLNESPQKLTPDERAKLASIREEKQAALFLNQFGRPARETPCECERSSSLSLGQALNLINGPTVADAVSAPNGRIAALVKADTDDGRLVDDIFLACLSRFPTAKERAGTGAVIHSAPTRLTGAQDLAWALLNSPAFLFNH